MDLFRRLAGLFGYKKISGQPEPRNEKPDRGELQVDEIVRQICAEVLAARPERYASLSLRNSARWIALHSEPPELHVAVACAALRGQRAFRQTPDWNSYDDHNQPRSMIFGNAVLVGLRFGSDQLLEALQGWSHRHLASQHYSAKVLLAIIEQMAARQIVTADTESALRSIADQLYSGYSRVSKEDLEVTARIEEILNPPTPGQTALPPGRFASTLRKWVDTLDREEHEPWLRFFLLCTEVGEKAKPSSKWLRKAKQSINDIGRARAGKRLFEILDTVDLKYSYDRDGIIIGFIWASTLLDHSMVAGALGRFAEGRNQNRPGNAVIWALSQMIHEPRAAAELFRLRGQIKHQGTRKLIDRRLAELAEKRGTTVGTLEDFSLPAFGLDQDSRLRMQFGEAHVELTVTPTSTVTQWTNGSGRRVRSAPAEVRDDFPDDLAAFRQQAKDVEEARKSQVLRLEQSWAEERCWKFSEWETHFLRHPLRRPIVGVLIWQIGDTAVLPDSEELKDVSGTAHVFAPDDRVRLWHPVLNRPQDVLAWRARIVELGLTQPVKQAYREIYVLTEAERATRTYSNRFAAHIIRQHQFTKICQARGWRYKLMGNWDGWNQPMRAVGANMTAEFQVETVDEVENARSSGVALHLSTDQVRFLDAEDRAVELERIEPIVFSEVMRDVDLFVAVTSVANDPNWADGGPNGRNRDYWQAWAFGDLGQTAVMRKELATWLVPKLSIADKLEIADKFLIVQGKRQKYAIHFGSSNIQILPDNRYLCIVPDRAPRETEGIKLPFEGDGLFSTILSKAFLLADEDKIKDETILRQL